MGRQSLHVFWQSVHVFLHFYIFVSLDFVVESSVISFGLNSPEGQPDLCPARLSLARGHSIDEYIHVLYQPLLRMFFQDGLTGSAWGDWANYAASPLRAFENCMRQLGFGAP